MGSAQKQLNEGEELIVDIHPHWIFLAPSVSSLLGVVIVGIIVIAKTNGTAATVLRPVAGVAVLVVLVWFAIRYVKWATTEFAVTNERVMSMTGVISKTGVQIPLDRINSVEYHRGPIERIIGAGDLIIESASQGGRQTFEDIRHPDEVQREINAQMQHTDRDARGGASAPVVTESVAEQLTKLDELRRNGVLSEAEFQAQKARLLDA
ncbi:MAG: PH domain-containing protein [Actinobacteria bacterium]|nr:PH domain-containing protein [Actinomycetota bacterium]